jgi:hypothetical protein
MPPSGVEIGIIMPGCELAGAATCARRAPLRPGVGAPHRDQAANHALDPRAEARGRGRGAATIIARLAPPPPRTRAERLLASICGTWCRGRSNHLAARPLCPAAGTRRNAGRPPCERPPQQRRRSWWRRAAAGGGRREAGAEAEAELAEVRGGRRGRRRRLSWRRWAAGGWRRAGGGRRHQGLELARDADEVEEAVRERVVRHACARGAGGAHPARSPCHRPLDR